MNAVSAADERTETFLQPPHEGGPTIDVVSVTKVPLRTITDWFVTAVESGSSYWCDKFHVVRGLRAIPRKKSGAYIWYDAPAFWANPGFAVRFTTHDDRKLNGVLTYEHMMRGLKLLTTRHEWHRMTEPDGCNWDANDADVFLQLCCFGEVIYG